MVTVSPGEPQAAAELRLRVCSRCPARELPDTAVQSVDGAAWVRLSHAFAQTALRAQLATPTTCPACAEQETPAPVRAAA